MLDVEEGLGRHRDALACNLNGESLTALDGISKAAKLRHEVCLGITFLDVSFALGCHGVSS